MEKISLAALDGLLLDAGNTLVGLDLDWVATELAARGVAVSVDELARAEAASRPVFSAELAQLTTTEGDDPLARYLTLALQRLPAGRVDARAIAGGGLAALVRGLVPVLRAGGRSDRLWSRVLPGVVPALEALRAHGLRLAVVSNSDGTIAGSLARLGLAHYFETILDSHLIGCEKPDPRIFVEALARLGLERARVAHVGDLYHVDVIGARRAGIAAVLLDPYDDWRLADCPRVVDLAALAARIHAARSRAGPCDGPQQGLPADCLAHGPLVDSPASQTRAQQSEGAA